MSIANICLGVFLILISLSQYLTAIVKFDKTGLLITGIIGMVAGVLIFIAVATESNKHPRNRA